jgi:hypothetical protein
MNPATVGFGPVLADFPLSGQCAHGNLNADDPAQLRGDEMFRRVIGFPRRFPTGFVPVR